MHSNIYQISNKPISEDEYSNSNTYCDNSSDFADYIGDEYEGEERMFRIENFAEIIKDVFAYKGNGEFSYKGPEALRKFKQAWCDAIKKQVEALTTDNIFRDMNLFRISKMTKKTHLDASSRVDIEDWAGGVAYPLGELFEYADSQLKKGDCIYIGAVIDYHF